MRTQIVNQLGLSDSDLDKINNALTYIDQPGFANVFNPEAIINDICDNIDNCTICIRKFVEIMVHKTIPCLN